MAREDPLRLSNTTNWSQWRHEQARGIPEAGEREIPVSDTTNRAGFVGCCVAMKQATEDRGKKRNGMDMMEADRVLSGNVGSPWLDVKQAAAYLGVCEKTIRRSCVLKGLKHTRIGRVIRIHRAELDRWMMTNNGG